MKNKTLILALLLLLSTGPLLCKAFFSDVNTDNIYYEPIHFLWSKGKVVGFPDNTYRANEYLTRSMAARSILSAYQENPFYALIVPDLNLSDTFNDMLPTDAFAKYLVKAEEFGVLGRDADGYFHPNRTITKAEFMKLLLVPSNTDFSALQSQYLYGDVQANAWFTRYMNFAGNIGLIIPDKDNNLYPSQIVNRGEASETAYLLYLFLRKDDTELYLGELQANVDQTLHYIAIGKTLAARRSAAIATGLGQTLYSIDPLDPIFLSNAKLAKANLYTANYIFQKSIHASNAQAWLDIAKTKLDEGLAIDAGITERADLIKAVW